MRLTAVLATISLAALLAACGGSSATPTPASATPAPAATQAPAATPAPASPASVASPVAGAAKVSANTATTEELVAALTAAGVSNADRWADEIEEYRPYDASDTTLDKLRSELAKYNPGEDTIDAILSVLQP